MHRYSSSGLGAHWRAEVLRTNLWLVPGIEVVAAIVLFAITTGLDHAAYRGEFGVPSWVISGTADAARQILTAIAAAVITVVGVVFSIILVTLTLASTQFGPRMLRNFIRDRGTQLTLGTFVATFVYAVLVLVSIGPGSHGDFAWCGSPRRRTRSSPWTTGPVISWSRGTRSPRPGRPRQPDG
jgi:uncharacterized membrane protein